MTDDTTTRHESAAVRALRDHTTHREPVADCDWCPETTPLDTATSKAPVERHTWTGLFGIDPEYSDPGGPNVPAVPARVSTPAELDALPVGSVVRGREGQVYSRMPGGWFGAGRSSVIGDAWDFSWPLSVLHAPGCDLLAEAAARGYERGKRDALTEAATWIERDPGRTSGAGIAEWLRARAAETPGAETRCPDCGLLDGRHGLVHRRHGNGGGSNVRCPRDETPGGAA